MIIDFTSQECMFINWLDKNNRYFMVQKFPGKLFLYFYFFEINFCWRTKSQGHSFKKMMDFAMADAKQELKSSEKFFDECGVAVAEGKIEVLEHLIAQYKLGD